MNYVQCSLLKDFRESCKRENSVQLVARMKNYIERATAKIERFVRGKSDVNKKEKNLNSAMTREKMTNDLYNDFANLFQLRSLETMCKSHS
jgi:hypothetical protein